MNEDLNTVRPLSAGHLKVLLAVNRLGAHEATNAMHTGRVAREADQDPETVKHLLNRLYLHGLLCRASNPDGWAYWLSTAGLAEVRKQVPS